MLRRGFILFQYAAEFRVQYEEPLGLLQIEWVGGCNLGRLRPALVALRQLAQELQAPQVLLDLSRLPDLPVFDQIWLSTYWMPTVLPLPLRQVVLVLGPEQEYNLHAIELLLATYQLFIRFDTQFFAQSDPGLQWLVAGAWHSPSYWPNGR